ncbi:MAG: hypothetical protein AAGA83_06110 [Cyanobacteria bacterium P01_F01_bin.116]
MTTANSNHANSIEDLFIELTPEEAQNVAGGGTIKPPKGAQNFVGGGMTTHVEKLTEEVGPLKFPPGKKVPFQSEWRSRMLEAQNLLNSLVQTIQDMESSRASVNSILAGNLGG